MQKVFKSILIGTVRVYQCTISPFLGPRCRFTPSCSHYAIDAVSQHNIVFAIWLTVKRLLRCHPFCQGGYDPVPQRKRVE